MSGDRRDDLPGDVAEVEAILRDLRDDPVDLEAPPDDLWDLIAADADVSAEPEPAVGAAVHDADVVPISSARRTRLLGIVGAAAAAIVLVVAGVVVFTGDDDEPIVAEAQLGFDEQAYDPLGATAATSAELIERSDGSFQVRLVDADLPAPAGGDEDLELWLLNDPTAPTDLVSLGLVDPDEPGTYLVPAGYDPSTFFVVDISVEPRDGEPTHSGRTILRGPLLRV